MNECIDKRLGPVSYYLEYPAYNGVKKDPRYIELLKRQNFTEEIIQTIL
jgi:hypothetical protein